MRILTITNDDSGHFVVRNFARLASRQGITCYHALLASKLNRAFVEKASVDPFFDFAVEGKTLFQPLFLCNFDAIFFAKAPTGFPTFCKASRFLDQPDRPVIIGAYPGLEFSPRRGFEHRLFCDVILFNTVWDRLVFQRCYAPFADNKVLLVGNPTLLNRWQESASRPPKPSAPDSSNADRGIFLGQSITPMRLEHRAALLKSLAAAPTGVPIAVKIRQQPREGAEHVHREMFGYGVIAEKEQIDLPIIYRPMDDVLELYDVFLSCSSTGALEAAAAGRRAGQFLKFPGWTLDPLHIASLGYTLRHGMGVSLEDPLAVREPNATFFTDFCLSADSEVFKLRAHIEALRQQGCGLRDMAAWERAQKAVLLDQEVALAYKDEGNPHKGLFLALASLVESKWDSSIRELVKQCRDELPPEDPAHSAVDAVLSSQGSFADQQRQRLEFAMGTSKPVRPKPASGDPSHSWARRAHAVGARVDTARRKSEKLRRDPQAFFEDSPKRVLRMIGRAWFAD